MNQIRPRSVFSIFPMILVATVVFASGCVFNNQILPLEGEDPNSLAFSGDQVVMLDKTGATIAVETFRANLLAGDREACFAALGPMSTAVLIKQAGAAAPADFLFSGKVSGFDIAGAVDPMVALASRGDARIEESELPRFSSRKVVVNIHIEGGVVLSLPVVFTDSGWRVELVSAAASAG